MSNVAEMSDAHWEALAEKMLFSPPQNRVAFDEFLQSMLGVYLADVAVEPGNSCPLDFCWDVYASAMGLHADPSFHTMAMAGRGTQKSLSGAVIETMLLIQDSVRDWFHCAAIMDQSERTYNYVQRFFSAPWLRKALEKDPLMKETRTIHGTMLQIGTGTIKSVSGFHGSVVMDEYDLMDRIVTKMAKGMLSAQQGHRPLMVYLSSRYFATGNVEAIVSGKSNIRLHKWGILEMTERCPAAWSGDETDQTHPIYVNTDELLAISPTAWSKMPEHRQQTFVELEGYPNCLSCGIFSFCKGNLKRQRTREENPFLEPLEETISKFRDNDIDTFKAQRLNEKPSTRDLVYSWDESIHVKSPMELVSIYLGSAPDTAIETPREVIDFFARCPDCVFYIGADPGYTEAAAGLYVVDGMDRIYLVDEITEAGLSEGDFDLVLWKRWGTVPVDELFPDQIPTFLKDLKTENPEKGKTGTFPISKRVDKSAGSVDGGIATVRKVLRIPGTTRSQFVAASYCVSFRAEMSQYKRRIDPKTDEPTDHVIKRSDHHPDQFRYFVHTVFGRGKGKLTVAGESGVREPQLLSDRTDVSQEPFQMDRTVRAPRAGELAQALGMVGFHDNSEAKAQALADRHHGGNPDDDPPKPKKAKLTWSL